jgi:Fe-S-cluster containining protein
VTPIFQTRFGKPHGNCFAACVVSIIGGRIEDFPDLSDLVEDSVEANTTRQKRIEGYMKKCGYGIIRCVGNMPPRQHVVAVGEGPRDLRHACVFLEGKLTHDPCPSGGGLKEVDAWYLIFPV